eukprot:COSAG05_NODE_21459_length_271_cov_2.098837_1_plen_20_part_10
MPAAAGEDLEGLREFLEGFG